jgi:hypothetical protein
MQPLRPATKVFAAITGLVVLFFGYLVWEFEFIHPLATLKLGDHQLQVTINHEWNVSHSVFCELRGPKWQHAAQLMAFIGAGESNPKFTVHQAPGRQVYWVTADPMPKTILYALDVETGEHWDSRESDTVGQKFLQIADSTDKEYRLYQYEWIGVRQ